MSEQRNPLTPEEAKRLAEEALEEARGIEVVVKKRRGYASDYWTTEEQLDRQQEEADWLKAIAHALLDALKGNEKLKQRARAQFELGYDQGYEEWVRRVEELEGALRRAYPFVEDSGWSEERDNLLRDVVAALYPEQSPGEAYREYSDKDIRRWEEADKLDPEMAEWLETTLAEQSPGEATEEE